MSRILLEMVRPLRFAGCWILILLDGILPHLGHWQQHLKLLWLLVLYGMNLDNHPYKNYF